MKSFSPAELAYLQGERRLGRIATADLSGRPQVTPVGMWRYNPELGTIDITGRAFATTRKYRNGAPIRRRRSSSTTSPASIPGTRGR